MILKYSTLIRYIYLKTFFHYIRLDQVLEHVDNPNEVLQFIKKLAKKNCIFFVAVPDGKRN